MDHIGIDVHKRESQIYILAEGGEIFEQRIRTEPERFAAVLGGCLYRSRFLFNAGWVLAVTFLLATALSVLYSVRTNDANEALLKENMVLFRDIAALREKLAALSATPPAERGPDKAVSPPKAASAPQRAVPPAKRGPQNAVPESEKWWNRP